ncbi:hypothetical protein DFH09DRAFT_1407931 [Mycena vulgaris]|nr:hypothetical protein DFH09DRAFT_1407931 [Mycena vulgaris]
MLQIPSSILSLSSFSSKSLTGLFGGFCIGAQVIFTVVLSAMSGSIPKDSFYYATRTTEIALLPTKCLLSTGTISFPYVATIAYATVTFASLFYILRAKGFSCSSAPSPHRNPDPTPHDSQSPSSRAHNQNGVGTQPPSPPPESGSSCSVDKTPRRSLWAWLLCLIVFILTISGVAGAYVYLTIHESRKRLTALAAFSHHGLWQIERGFFGGCSAVASCILRFKTYISLHGSRHSKIVLIALSSHSASLLVVCALRRMLVNLSRVDSFGLCVFAVVFAAIASSSHLSWIIWIRYYFGIRCGVLPIVRQIKWDVLRLSSSLSSLAVSHFVEISTTIGVILAHSAAVLIWTACLVLYNFPSAARVVTRVISSSPCCFLACCIGVTLFSSLQAFIDSSWLLYHFFNSDLRKRLWTPSSYHELRDDLQTIFRLFVQHYQEWKSGELEEFHELTAGLSNTLMAGFNSSWEMWSDLSVDAEIAHCSPGGRILWLLLRREQFLAQFLWLWLIAFLNRSRLVAEFYCLFEGGDFNIDTDDTLTFVFTLSTRLRISQCAGPAWVVDSPQSPPAFRPPSQVIPADPRLVFAAPRSDLFGYLLGSESGIPSSLYIMNALDSSNRGNPLRFGS